jgi:hypothetical protein
VKRRTPHMLPFQAAFLGVLAAPKDGYPPRIPVTVVEPDDVDPFPPGISPYCRQLIEADARHCEELAAVYRRTAHACPNAELAHRNLVIARQCEWLASDYRKLLALSAPESHP